MKTCLACKKKFDTGKKLSNHFKKEHGLSPQEYTIKYVYKGKRPVCKSCSDDTRYVALTFKDYCSKCAKVAMRKGGKRGGAAQAWNKGKTKKDDPRIKGRLGKDNSFYGKKHTKKTRDKIRMTKLLNRGELRKRINERKGEFKLLTPLDEYISRQRQYLEFKCKKCKTISKKTLQAFERGSLCPKCNPVGSSQGEVEIANWLADEIGVKIKHKDRSVIAPKELDITIPEHKLAIEFNGLYWHSDNGRVTYDKRAHFNKTELCKEMGWKLIHIFSDEWHEKQDICKSMILHRLGLSPKRVHARKCTVRELQVHERRVFFIMNHISGDVPSIKSWGLFDGDTLVAALSIRKPRQKKWKGKYEIARFATRLNHHINGGMQKLFKRAMCENIEWLTYADRRFGEGFAYANLGFKDNGITGIDYWYTDGQVRLGRAGFRTKPGLSERKQASQAGIQQIHGCGSRIWVINKS
jgi:hypothetical protein